MERKVIEMRIPQLSLVDEKVREDGEGRKRRAIQAWGELKMLEKTKSWQMALAMGMCPNFPNYPTKLQRLLLQHQDPFPPRPWWFQTQFWVSVLYSMGFHPSIYSHHVAGFGSHGTVVFRGSFQGRSVAVKRL